MTLPKIDYESYSDKHPLLWAEYGYAIDEGERAQEYCKKNPEEANLGVLVALFQNKSALRRLTKEIEKKNLDPSDGQLVSNLNLLLKNNIQYLENAVKLMIWKSNEIMYRNYLHAHISVIWAKIDGCHELARRSAGKLFSGRIPREQENEH